MSLELRMPLDFERHPEYRMLCAALTRRMAGGLTLEQIESVATRLWVRLSIELGYLAQTTNLPGFLTPDGVGLYCASVAGLFGDDCKPTQVLEESKLIEPRDGGFFCEWFARFNAHLSGDHKKKEDVGAANSAAVRQQKRLSLEAVQQGQLLPIEIFRKRDGSALNTEEQKRALILIRNVDSALERASRRTMEYTEGLIADAAAVVDGNAESVLLKFYGWLRLHRDKACVHKTTEQILADFENLHAVSRGKVLTANPR